MPLENARTPNADASGRLSRILGPFDATCIVIGAIVGVGIFLNPTQVAQKAGSANMALLAWTVGGLIALCGALTFAELGTRYPNSGGQYEVLRDAYGPLPGFLFVFCNATAIQAGAIAIIAWLCAENLAAAVTPNPIGSRTSIGMSIILILGVTAANVAGVRFGSRIQNLTVLAKLVTIAVVIMLAIFGSTTAAAEPTGSPASPVSASNANWLLVLFAAIVPSFFAYGGWQHALWIAGEVREPRRNLPLAIVGGVVVVVAAYVSVNWAYLHLLGYADMTQSKTLAADAVARVWPDWGRRAAAAAVAISALGVLNAQLLSGPRLIFRMAQDGRFFHAFAGVNRQAGTPAAAIILLGGMGLVLLLLAAALSSDVKDAINRLTTGVVFIDGIFFVLTGLALFVLRRRDERTSGAHEVTPPLHRVRLGYPIAPAIFVLGEIGIVVGAHADSAGRMAAATGVGWIAVAALLYASIFRRAQPA